MTVPVASPTSAGANGSRSSAAQLRRSKRRAQAHALLLVAPLGLFILLAFGWPLASMLSRSVTNNGFGDVFYRTAEAISAWDGKDLPPEAVFAALAGDLRQAQADQRLGGAATMLNYEWSGARSLMVKTVKRMGDAAEGNWKPVLIEIDQTWADPALWALIGRMVKPLTARHYLTSLDLQLDANGAIQSVDPDRSIYGTLFLRTLWVGAAVTAICLVLGYPVAFLLASLPMRVSNLLMILVLLPFWTSLLVRTTAWIVLLQSRGVVNDVFVWAGLISDDHRLPLIFNVTGTLIAMTHVLLPFMILPLYSVMKTISPSYMRAARSLGASSFTAFRRVYLPQTAPGIAAGSLLVFVLAIGYYITPALVGGQSGQMISNIIVYHMQQSLNWGLAAALGTLLLTGVLLVYWLFNRLTGGNGLKMG